MPTEKEMSPVDRSIRGLRSKLEEVHAALSGLEGRLNTVLVPVPPPAQADLKIPVPDAERLADRIGAAYNTADRLAARIGEIVSRLEI